MATLNSPTLPFLAATIIASSISCSRAFLLSSPITTQISPTTIVPSQASPTSLYGIQEWRDQAYEEHYTLEIFNQVNPDRPPQVPATVPILPFPFTDILMQGQRKQLNLYEQRFHDLFQDAMDNHHGMIGMGLLLGRGMITTMPLCEIESFTRFGYDEKNWVDTGNGMGNGSIFVTIRAVGRAKIVESDLIQEEPYFKARVVEVVDEPLNVEMGKNIGIKEKGGSSSSSSDNYQVAGESSPVEIGSLVASTIENLMVTLSSMEHKLKEINAKKKKESDSSSSSPQVVAENEDTEGDQDEVMNKRLAAARLEELFMKDSSDDGVDLDEDLDSTNARNGEDDEDISSSNEEDEEEEDDDDDDDDDSEILDRVAQFQEAFESAKETDHQGYILPPIPTASDNLSSSENQKVPPLRSPKDLTAISWAAFCTTGGLKDDNDGSSSSSKDSIQRQAIQIQALDMTNVIQRMQLASAMLREEQKSLKAKLALAGIQDILKGGDGGVGGDELS